ncbi:MAG: transporter [Hyphomicrobiaceae bacterium]
MTAIFIGRLRGVTLWATLALLEAGAQVTLKLAAIEASAAEISWAGMKALLGSPWFLASVACDACAFLVWMAVLARHDLSLAVPVSACSYFAIMLASSLVLLEPVATSHLAGIGLIGVGIVLIAND